MNRGHLLHQSSPVQQMMAANPNWWNVVNTNTTRPDQQQQQQQLPSPFFSPPPNAFLPPYSSSSLPLPSWLHDHSQDLPPDSWTQLILMGGSVGEEAKKLSWEDHEQVLVLSTQAAPNEPPVDNIKQESSVNSYGYGNGDEFQPPKPPASASASAWPPRILLPRPSPSASASASSPKSCVTSFSTDLLDFSNTTTTDHHLASRQQPLPDPSPPPECNSGGAAKKARVQASTTQSCFKVRKEKLGDRITALHQLVSPFGKTDTASVLLEAIGYIRFLQSQIEALSLPYLGTGSPNMRQHQVQHSVQGESNCIFPEDPGQLLNEKCLKRKAAGNKLQDSREEGKKDLRSRGLCLVPVSCTMQVGSENGADYWAPALGGGFR